MMNTNKGFDFIVHGYCLKRKIGRGSFGDIYIATNTSRNDDDVAIKIESKMHGRSQLQHESNVYRTLGVGLGIPQIRYFGKKHGHACLVMDLLGPSLEYLFSLCERRFTFKTVLMLADQMLERIQFLHSKNFIHRDIKPDNFLMGVGRYSGRVYLVDYGLAKQFFNPLTRQHIAYRENKNLTGTARYSSINAHFGRELSRRDDLLSLGYALVYFVRGSLPWQDVKAVTKSAKYDIICDMAES